MSSNEERGELLSALRKDRAEDYFDGEDADRAITLIEELMADLAALRQRHAELEAEVERLQQHIPAQAAECAALLNRRDDLLAELSTLRERREDALTQRDEAFGFIHGLHELLTNFGVPVRGDDGEYSLYGRIELLRQRHAEAVEKAWREAALMVIDCPFTSEDLDKLWLASEAKARLTCANTKDPKKPRNVSDFAASASRKTWVPSPRCSGRPTTPRRG